MSVMRFTLVLPVHQHPVRLWRFFRAFREFSSVEHDLLIVVDRGNMPVVFDCAADRALFQERCGPVVVPAYPPPLDRVARYNAGYLPAGPWCLNALLDSIPLPPRACIVCAPDTSARLGGFLAADGTSITPPVVQALRARYGLRAAETLGDLAQHDFGGAWAMNWALAQEGLVETERFAIIDDDMLLLPGWDETLTHEIEHFSTEFNAQTVYIPKVFTVAERSEEPGLRRHAGTYEIVLPVRLDGSADLAQVRRFIEPGADRVTIENCTVRQDGSSIPLFMTLEQWQRVRGRDHLIASNEDDWWPGRLVGGDELHFETKLAAAGIAKAIVWNATCLHTKLALGW